MSHNYFHWIVEMGKNSVDYYNVSMLSSCEKKTALIGQLQCWGDPLVFNYKV